jgi:serine-threonine kinase receptor-associated protein
MLRDGTTGDWIGSFAGHKGAVWSCQLDASGSLAATASGDFSAKLWDAITGQHLQTLPHLHIVKTCAFSPPTSNNNKACYSNLLATGGQEGCLRIYDLEATLLGGSDQPRWSLMHPQQPKACSITKLVWLNESTLLAGCVDGKIRVWQVPSNDVSLAESSSLQPVAILDTKTGKEIRDMELTTRLPSNNSQSILTVASADQVLFFDMSTTASFPLLKQFQMPINFLNEGGASLHPTSGSKFIAGGSDLWVRVFDYETGDMLECLKGHHGPIRCLRYSPDGSSYASGSEDGTIRLWKT